MQKIIFYQEVQPKAADALWLHHGYDSNGNKKESISIDYIQNGVVRHIMDACSCNGSTSDVYKPYLRLNFSFEWETADPDGLTFTSAAEAAQSLGISEQDFLKLCSAQMPTLVDTGEACLTLNTYAEDFEEEGLGYVTGTSGYVGISDGIQYDLSVLAFKESSEADDSTKQYIVSFYSENLGGSIGGGPK